MNSNLQRRTFLQRLMTLGILGTSPFGAIKTIAATPYPRPDGLTVLFQGDSITDGGRWQKSSDLNHIMGQSYPYLLSSRLGYENPRRQWKFINRGISGNTVADLLERWQPDAIDLKPDIISVLMRNIFPVSRHSKMPYTRRLRTIGYGTASTQLRPATNYLPASG